MTDTPATETSPAESPARPANPYTVALLLISLAALVAAGIAAVLGGMLQRDPYTADPGTGPLLWAGILAQFGVAVGLLWLLASAVTWKPSARDSR